MTRASATFTESEVEDAALEWLDQDPDDGTIRELEEAPVPGWWWPATEPEHVPLPSRPNQPSSRDYRFGA